MLCRITAMWQRGAMLDVYMMHAIAGTAPELATGRGQFQSLSEGAQFDTISCCAATSLLCVS